MADIYPYPNSVRVLKVDAATVQEWLERSASIFLRVDPSLTTEQPLLGPAFACYNFDVIDGVEYSIDVTQPARYDNSGALIAPDARRIRGLTYKGAPIDQQQTFLVVTNNYRASGGGGFPGCDSRHSRSKPPTPIATSSCVTSKQPKTYRPDPTATGASRLCRHGDRDLFDVPSRGPVAAAAARQIDRDGSASGGYRISGRDGVICGASALSQIYCSRVTDPRRSRPTFPSRSDRRSGWARSPRPRRHRTCRA